MPIRVEYGPSAETLGEFSYLSGLQSGRRDRQLQEQERADKQRAEQQARMDRIREQQERDQFQISRDVFQTETQKDITAADQRFQVLRVADQAFDEEYGAFAQETAPYLTPQGSAKWQRFSKEVDALNEQYKLGDSALTTENYLVGRKVLADRMRAENWKQYVIPPEQRPEAIVRQGIYQYQRQPDGSKLFLGVAPDVPPEERRRATELEKETFDIGNGATATRIYDPVSQKSYFTTSQPPKEDKSGDTARQSFISEMVKARMDKELALGTFDAKKAVADAKEIWDSMQPGWGYEEQLPLFNEQPGGSFGTPAVSPAPPRQGFISQAVSDAIQEAGRKRTARVNAPDVRDAAYRAGVSPQDIQRATEITRQLKAKYQDPDDLSIMTEEDAAAALFVMGIVNSLKSLKQ